MERSTTQRVGTGVKALPVSPGTVSKRHPQWFQVHCEGLAVVASVGQDETQSLKTLLGQLLQGRFAADAVVLVGRPDVSGQQQAASIDQ